VYSADDVDVELCPSEKVMRYSYVALEMMVSVSVQGYDVPACSRVVTVRLATMVTSVGPYNCGLLTVVSVVDHTSVHVRGESVGADVCTGTDGESVDSRLKTGLAEAKLVSMHPKTNASSARRGLIVDAPITIARWLIFGLRDD